MSNTTELPNLDKLSKIGNLIMTQDNRITDQPMFIVQQRRRMYGLDTGYCENFIWLCSEDEYNEASAEEAAALEAEYQDTGRAKDGWQRTGYIDQWEFVTACFTEQGCIDYLKLDGHNLKEPRIYAEGSYRNEEFRAVRNSLIALARRAQPEGEAPQADDEAEEHRREQEYFDRWPDAPAASLSPLCGAQHAESGKERGSIGDLTEFHILLNWYDNEASYGSINEGRNKLTEYIDKWASKRAAQLDGGQEGSEAGNG